MESDRPTTPSASPLLRARLLPPPPGRRCLARLRLIEQLSEALQQRLTLLQAGAGYGKSTALSELAAQLSRAAAANGPRLAWYQPGEEDGEPQSFFRHLAQALSQALPELSGLETAASRSAVWGIPWSSPAAAQQNLAAVTPEARSLVDQILNALSQPQALELEVLIILDDIHLAIEQNPAAADIALPLDRLIGLAPPQVHFLLAGRPPLTLPNLNRWRARGQVLELDQRALRFTDEEIDALFRQHYQRRLQVEEVQALQAYTEGWPMALALIGQKLRLTETEQSSTAVTALLPAFAPPRPQAYYSGPEVPRPDQPDSELDPAAELAGTLFEILADEVFSRQPEDIRRFLVLTAVLRRLDPLVCDALLAAAEGAQSQSITTTAALTYLRQQDVFLSARPAIEEDHRSQAERYHPIFQSFLRRRLTKAARIALHKQAAQIIQIQTPPDQNETLYHWLAAEEWEEAALTLETLGEKLLAAGRLDVLGSLLEALPPEKLNQHPLLLFYLGEAARLHSHFQQALGWYEQAEKIWRLNGRLEGAARALRGQARVYLDTVNPSQAERLLEEAIRLSDGFVDREAQVRLYELLAENKLNAGRAAEAERLRQKAAELEATGPSNEQLWFRVLLRTGRLVEARQALEEKLASERLQPVQTPRAHRETLLLLSLIYSLQGEGQSALEAAIEGTRRGQELESPFITAVGYIRQGHALQLLGGPQAWGEGRMESVRQACRQLETGIEISRKLDVPRLQVEANWGLCRAYGILGELDKARQAAAQALEIAGQAGDEWIASLVQLALGSGLALAHSHTPGELRAEAEGWLLSARRGFEACSDPLGRCAARLWLCWLAWKSPEFERGAYQFSVQTELMDILATCRQNGYGFLFSHSSLIGAAEGRAFTPLLVAASLNHNSSPQPAAAPNLQAFAPERSYAAGLLKEMGLGGSATHAGYRLRVFTMGGFRVWRGDELLQADAWQRQKARQLFQLLLSERLLSPPGRLTREQICEALWPEADPAAAGRNFKSALSALYQALEPGRKPGSESAFIERMEGEDGIYGIRPEADLWLDAEVLSQDLSLYNGEYLPELRYDPWAEPVRTRLVAQFLEQANRQAEVLLAKAETPENLEQVIALCRRMLEQDNCQERAYRSLMLAYHRLGDLGQVGRTYQRCIQALKSELELEPSAETQALYRMLVTGL